jgi:hypothetical protein
MAIQGSSINLQGGGNISIQGSTRNPQPAAGIALFQPALSGIKIQNATGGASMASTPKPAAVPAYTPPATIAAPVAPVPRLAQFDLSSAYNKALQAAQAAINPVYAAELSRFVDSQNQALTEQQQAGTATKSALDLALERLHQDSNTTRTRTTEDTNTNIGDINATQAFNARNEGLSFDTTNRALNEGLGANGMAGSGLGEQQVEDQQQTYRNQSNEEVRQSDNKVAAANTLMARTFQDLDTQETRTGEDTTTKKAQVDVDLQNFIKDQQLKLESEKAQEEANKQGDILTATNTNQQSQIQQWIAGLRGQGYTPQEIALAAQVYG